MTKEELEAKIAAAAFLNRLEKRGAGKCVMLSQRGRPQVRQVMKGPKYKPAMRRPKRSVGRTTADAHVKESAADPGLIYDKMSAFWASQGKKPVMSKRRFMRYWRSRMTKKGVIEKVGAPRPETMQEGDTARLLKGMGIIGGGAALGALGGYGIRKSIQRWAAKALKSGGTKKVEKAEKALRMAGSSPITGGVVGTLIPTAYLLAAKKRDKALKEYVRGGRK